MPSVCPAHGAGSDPSLLVGVRLQRVVASRHIVHDQVDGEPIDLWLIDDTGTGTHITTGSDWCLIVEASAPRGGYDMGTLGRIEEAYAEGCRLVNLQSDGRPGGVVVTMDSTTVVVAHAGSVLAQPGDTAPAISASNLLQRPRCL